MKVTSEATIHYCDGCGTPQIQLKNEDLPSGFYLDVTDVTKAGADSGQLYVCHQRCILPAFKRRHDVWNKT